MIAVAQFLAKCNETRPREIHRKIRSFDNIKFWKATEFRTFLLYIGVVFLKNHITPAEYEMFKVLFCATTICSSNMYKKLLPAARSLFADFTEMHINLYGEQSITINIHNTSHVVDDVEQFGPLNTISAYPFENQLHQLKMKLQQCNYPLQQVARRLIERSQCKNNLLWNHQGPNFPVLENDFFLPDGSVAYNCIKYKANTTLSNTEKDKWFLTKSNHIIEFAYFVRDGHGNNLIFGSALKNTGDFFETPFESKLLNIFSSDGDKNEPEYFKLETIKAKMYCLPSEGSLVFIPLLHTL